MGRLTLTSRLGIRVRERCLCFACGAAFLIGRAVQEAVDGLRDRRRVRRDVVLRRAVGQRALRELRRERDLAHRMAGREQRELEQPLEARDARELAVGLGGLGEDVDQPAGVVDQARGADLVLGLAQEVLLARGAHEVGVGVAEAHVVQRVAAPQSFW